MLCFERNCSLRIFARGFAHGRRFNAVVNRIADKVNERVVELFDYSLIKLCFSAFSYKLYVFLKVF